jgi:hypothetical protein
LIRHLASNLSTVKKLLSQENEENKNMLVSVEGLEQGAIETELSILPRKGETIRVFYGQMRS